MSQIHHLHISLLFPFPFLRPQKDIIQAVKEKKNCQARLVHSAKLTFLIEGPIKTFYNKEKLKKFMTTKPALQKRHK
jgi:hypothetical protein